MSLSQAMRAFSPMRDLYQMQSEMTVNGCVPTMADVRAQFDSIFPAQGRAAAPDGLPNSGSNNHSAGCGNGPAKES